MFSSGLLVEVVWEVCPLTPDPSPPAGIAVYTNRHILLECGNAKDCHQNVSRAPPP